MKVPIAVLLLITTCLFAQQTPNITPPGGELIKVTSMSPKSPATIAAGEKFTVAIHYTNPGKNRVVIFALPYANGNPIQGFDAQPMKPLPKGSGDVEQWFSFATPTAVDEVRINIVNVKTDKILGTEKIPVKLTWK